MLNLSPIKFLFSDITTQSKKYLGLSCSFDINAGYKKTISNKKKISKNTQVYFSVLLQDDHSIETVVTSLWLFNESVMLHSEAFCFMLISIHYLQLKTCAFIISQTFDCDS